MAHAAARLDLPMVANVIEFGENNELVRVRWGGSLLERCTLDAPVRLVTIAHSRVARGRVAATATASPLGRARTNTGRTLIRERVERAAGVTLSTAPVVVSGGRGVGSADGFAPLQELARPLVASSGCSRRSPTSVGATTPIRSAQTGTRIAPDIYIACGISGAIQHWVGRDGIEEDPGDQHGPEANMVTKADYAVIGDLHQVVPAITAEIQRRRG
jgi:electron transfer flavoprotein alpha subunit